MQFLCTILHIVSLNLSNVSIITSFVIILSLLLFVIVIMQSYFLCFFFASLPDCAVADSPSVCCSC